jgi:hypothetical protein
VAGARRTSSCVSDGLFMHRCLTRVLPRRCCCPPSPAGGVLPYDAGDVHRGGRRAGGGEGAAGGASAAGAAAAAPHSARRAAVWRARRATRPGGVSGGLG